MVNRSKMLCIFIWNYYYVCGCPFIIIAFLLYLFLWPLSLFFVIKNH